MSLDKPCFNSFTPPRVNNSLQNDCLESRALFGARSRFYFVEFWNIFVLRQLLMRLSVS